MPPFCSVGTSVARIGIVFLVVPSTLSSVSNVSRFKKPSVVFADRIGLSVLGERWIATRSSPGTVPAVRVVPPALV